MKIFIASYEDYKLMSMGKNGYFTKVELPTGNFVKDLEHQRFMHKIYQSDVFITFKGDTYNIHKSRSGYHLDRIVEGKNKYTKKEIYRMFGRWIDNKTIFNMTLRAREHYEKYAPFCRPTIAGMFK